MAKRLAERLRYLFASTQSPAEIRPGSQWRPQSRPAIDHADQRETFMLRTTPPLVVTWFMLVSSALGQQGKLP
ncbi:MAG: hypothetical protein MI861_05930, partial [Pirellulales bacterium]|nr:hypothetical protein [Pirellulales bacterium]